MGSFIYKFSERNNEEYLDLLKRKLSRNEPQGNSSPGSIPCGIQTNQMNQRHISDRAYPSDYTPTIKQRDLKRLFEMHR